VAQENGVRYTSNPEQARLGGPFFASPATFYQRTDRIRHRLTASALACQPSAC